MKKLAMFNDDEDEETSSFQSKPLDQQKLSQFTSTTVRKSKREKEAEAAEAKRREEEEHAAKAYADFLDAFEAPSTSAKPGGGFVRSLAGGDDPRPYNPPTTSRAPRREDDDLDLRPEPAPSAPKPKGKRAMDSFLEEIKREQAEREDRHKRRNVAHSSHSSATAMAAYETQRGSRDTGDPETTNIFVANLPPNVTETTLGHFFARQGPVGSVKIMWPRGDATSGVGADITSTRKSKSAGLSGFVQYMKRKDAEACVREMDGFDWGGSVLRVGWSKAVPLAPRAMFERERSKSPGKIERGPRRRSHSPSRSRSHSRSRSPYHDRDGHRTRDRKDKRSERDRGHERNRGRGRHSESRSYSRSRSPERSHHGHHSRNGSSRHHRRSRSRSTSQHRKVSRSRSRSRSRRTPTRELDYQTREFIRTVAEDCQNHGKEYEENLKQREKDNRKYAFLWKSSAPGFDYFKSLRSGAYKPSADFDDDGSQTVWSTDSADESEKERTLRKEVLGKLARRRLEALLRRQTGRREDTARAMVFCIDHAYAAPQITNLIIASLLIDSTAVPRKVARLHLICDILHNSAISVHKAWKFRQEFQARLPPVFDHLSTIYHSFPGRMTADIFKKQILSVVEVWEDWIVFPPEFTQELRARLEGTSDTAEHNASAAEEVLQEAAPVEAPLGITSKFKAAAFKPADHPADTSPSVAEDIDGEIIDEIDGEPVGEDDLDGMPLDGDALDGDPLDGESLDGERIPEDVPDRNPPDESPKALPTELARSDENGSDVSMEMDENSD